VLHTNSHTALLISSIVLIAIGEVSLNTIAQTLLVRVLPSEYFSVLQVQWCSIVKHAQENAHTHTHTHTHTHDDIRFCSVFGQCRKSHFFCLLFWPLSLRQKSFQPRSP
jgi:ABC-type nickel/cobalt efflux system permease component RcnA